MTLNNKALEYGLQGSKWKYNYQPILYNTQIIIHKKVNIKAILDFKFIIDNERV